MIKVQRDVASFLVRFTQDLWQDDEGEPHIQWRGHIRHIQGDNETRFTDFAEAVSFIQKYLTQLTLDALNTFPGGDKMDQEETLRESFKLWEKFASSYTNMMFDAMERTIKQSDAIREQMDETVKSAMKSWQPPTQTDQGQIVEALHDLKAQIQILTEKVERLEKGLGEKSRPGSKST
jgi:hypothetical protein